MCVRDFHVCSNCYRIGPIFRAIQISWLKSLCIFAVFVSRKGSRVTPTLFTLTTPTTFFANFNFHGWLGICEIRENYIPRKIGPIRYIFAGKDQVWKLTDIVQLFMCVYVCLFCYSTNRHTLRCRHLKSARIPCSLLFDWLSKLLSFLRMFSSVHKDHLT